MTHQTAAMPAETRSCEALDSRVARPPVREPAGVPALPSASPGAAVARGWPLGDFLAFAPYPEAVQGSRLHTRHILREWGVSRLSDPAEHVVDELVSNAVTVSAALPGTCPVWLWLFSDLRAVLVMVWDASPCPPRPADADLCAENGRGLLLVDYFSAEWNWYPAPETGGKTVWALITSPPPLP